MKRPSRASGPRVISDTWLTQQLDIAEYSPGLLARRSSFAYAIGLLYAARGYAGILTHHGRASTRILSLLLLVLRRRKLILLEFLPGSRRGIRAALGSALWHFTLRRVALRIQVMSSWESEYYAGIYRLPVEAFRWVRYPLQTRPTPDEGAGGVGMRVMASGRNSCDWSTLARAALGQGWDLVLVCARQELGEVARTFRRYGAIIYSEIPPAEHEELLKEAAVYVLALREQNGSAGHVRLASAIGARVPVVATRVRGLVEYLDGTAVATEPGDWLAIRHSVNELLQDPDLREAKALRAQQSVAGNDIGAYLDSVWRNLIIGV